ncbi:MAG: hypothetical protein JWQ81_5895 [Amycolatopsis sp.]|jgi:ribosomal protein L30E|nr:hypothetical protein [Amycolatopsis sp.]
MRGAMQRACRVRPGFGGVPLIAFGSPNLTVGQIVGKSYGVIAVAVIAVRRNARRR